MGLTSKPTKVDGELGRNKKDVDPVRNHYDGLPAGEWNTVTDAVAAMVQEVGLEDGSDLDSLVAIAKNVNAPTGRPSDGVLVDDFTHLAHFSDGDSGGGASQIVSGETEAAGAVELRALSASQYAARIDLNTWFVAGLLPVLEARVKTQAVFADVDFIVGFGNAVNGSHTRQATMQPKATGWDCVTQGSAGTQTDSSTVHVPSVSSWYKIRIELVPDGGAAGGTVRFYVDDVLISTITEVTDLLPAETDSLSRYMGATFVANSGGIPKLDWMVLRMNRASV